MVDTAQVAMCISTLYNILVGDVLYTCIWQTSGGPPEIHETVTIVICIVVCIVTGECISVVNNYYLCFV